MVSPIVNRLWCSCPVGRRHLSTRGLRSSLHKPSSFDKDYANVYDVISDGGQQFNLGASFSVDAHLQHFTDFASLLAPLLPPAPGSKIVDLGAGSGALGFLCAFLYPEAQFTLVDCRANSCDYMQACVLRLGLTDRVSILHDRAEGLGRSPAHRHTYDGVMARRFGPPPATAECSAPLLARNGFLLVSDPNIDSKCETSDIRWPAKGLSRVGLVLERTIMEPAMYASVMRAMTPCSDDYPRSRKLKGGSKALY